MKTETEEKIVKIFNEKILTPVLFMIETEAAVDLIGFFDRDLDRDTIFDAEKAIYEATGHNVEILDIREFPESDRLDVLHCSKLIYSESDLVEAIFTMSMMEDLNIMLCQREEMLLRYNENNTPYLQ